MVKKKKQKKQLLNYVKIVHSLLQATLRCLFWGVLSSGVLLKFLAATQDRICHSSCLIQMKNRLITFYCRESYGHILQSTGLFLQSHERKPQLESGNETVLIQPFTNIITNSAWDGGHKDSLTFPWAPRDFQTFLSRSVILPWQCSHRSTRD